MKTFEFRPHVHGRPKSKIILIMKICTFILLVFNLGLSASGYSQQKKVTLDFKNATSKEFFLRFKNKQVIVSFLTPIKVNRSGKSPFPSEIKVFRKSWKKYCVPRDSRTLSRMTSS